MFRQAFTTVHSLDASFFARHDSQTFRPALPAEPRKLDPEITLTNLIEWTFKAIKEQRAEGAVIGLDGTDSLLAYHIVKEAFKKLGCPENVLGIHFERSEQFKADKIANLKPSHLHIAAILSKPYDAKEWLLEKHGPFQSHDLGEHHGKESYYLAYLQHDALRNHEGKNFWRVGTRTRTETELFKYSNLSSTVSAQPIIGLWKSEVLQLCKHIGVPNECIERSRMPDCFCGREELAAKNIEVLDYILMTKSLKLDPKYLNRFDPELIRQLNGHVDSYKEMYGYKPTIPYCPPDSILASK